jgi:hypothetical protein
MVTIRHGTTMHALLETVQRKCFLYGQSLGYTYTSDNKAASASGGNIKLQQHPQCQNKHANVLVSQREQCKLFVL